MIMAMIAANCRAATHYVVTNGTPGWIGAANPYTNWATAGTNIIDVVNAAVTNNNTPRIVWVSNGVYKITNQINAYGQPITIQSVNGRGATILERDGSSNTNRCVYIGNPYGLTCVFDGFTVTNYNIVDNNGTVFNPSASPLTVQNCLFAGNSNMALTGGNGNGAGLMFSWGLVTNCIFSNNYASGSGAGIYAVSVTGTKTVRVENCIFYGNRSRDGSGGSCYLEGNNITVSNCVVANNRCSSMGGGIYITGGTNLNILTCTVTSNFADRQGGAYVNGNGGGIYCLGQTLIKDCSIIGNIATNIGGGICGTNMTIRNCLIALNRAPTNIGGGVWFTNGSMESCTIASNYAGVSGGGLYIKDVGSGTNNIVYFNTAPAAANFTNTAGNTGLDYSCVIPAVDGTRNITNDPSLANLNGGNYRLDGNSPCVNAGLNKDWMTNTVDLDGRSRIRYGTVDMGAYERINAGVIYTVH